LADSSVLLLLSTNEVDRDTLIRMTDKNTMGSRRGRRPCMALKTSYEGPRRDPRACRLSETNAPPAGPFRYFSAWGKRIRTPRWRLSILLKDLPN
jgi:hypothetical protein